MKNSFQLNRQIVGAIGSDRRVIEMLLQRLRLGASWKITL